MATRKPIRVRLWVSLACLVSLVIFVVRQHRMQQLAFKSERTAGLAAVPDEVHFDLRSMWSRSGAFGISGSIPNSMTAAIAGQSLILPPPASADTHFSTESYDSISDNPFIAVAADPRATFSVDVDTASYANMRRFISQGEWPPKDSVRIEEMVNYFPYDYPQPAGSDPIAVQTEVASAPWQPDHRLVRIGIKAKGIDMSRRPAANLVFLIDVSGSMDEPNKLPLLKSALRLLVDRLNVDDRVAIVVYAGEEGLALPSTDGNQKAVLLNAIDTLSPGGSTNGAAGIQLAYRIAASSFIKSGINRVILATDGDFNVGVTNQGDLVRIIEERAKSGVFLSVLGFGVGNIKDSTLEKLADKGNGNYAYIDTLNEARKVFQRGSPNSRR